MTKASDKTNTSGDTGDTDAETTSTEAEAGERHARIAGVQPASEVDGSTIDARPASETNDPRYQDTGLDRDGATERSGLAASDFNADRDSAPEADES